MRRQLMGGLALLWLLAACGGTTAQNPTIAGSVTPLPATAGPSPTPTPNAELRAGDQRTDPYGIAQVWVGPGCFMMGTDPATVTGEIPAWAAKELPSEQPRHEVCLTSGFWIDQFEVTNAAWQGFVAAGGYEDEELWSPDGWRWRGKMRTLPAKCQSAEPDQPRACVTWYEADAYARWRGGALPSEAQWEYAARGPESRIYPWGDAFVSANTNVLSSTGTVAVGSYPAGASWVGAHDMSGNVMEWVNDWLDPAYYQAGVRDDPPGPATGAVKVEKGGWWGSNPFVARAAYRHFEDRPSYADKHIGLRVA
ncbi:MAG TPA: SUMF1/EgtB/PvdO family nonheme iron enzyme, partial [Herpetosiphonaceae bacterium]